MPIKICVKPESSDLLVIDTFVHVIILLIILFVFFVFLISRMETDELTSQIQNQINNGLPKLYDILDDKSDNSFKKMIQKLNTPISQGNKSSLEIMSEYYDKPDQATINWNRTLYVGTTIILGALIFGFIGVWITLVVSCKKCVPVGRIILENIILFLLIGVVEIIFFLKIATKYVPIKPSYFVDTTLDSLRSRF